jgi:tetraacyldisaccharide-1-P 4'-kinase
VLIDALDPFGGGHPLPLGRLREPLEELSRAGIFVITRSDSGRLVESVEHQLRSYNPRAPIFHARVRPEVWVSCGTGESIAATALPYSRVAAFCGLGNPESFWSTLSALGLNVVDRLRFDDHHAYRPWELRFLSHQFRQAGAEAILTTEKDMLNLCEDCHRQFEPLPLCWLRIGMQLDREDEFLRAITDGIRSGR